MLEKKKQMRETSFIRLKTCKSIQPDKKDNKKKSLVKKSVNISQISKDTFGSKKNSIIDILIKPIDIVNLSNIENLSQISKKKNIKKSILSTKSRKDEDNLKPERSSILYKKNKSKSKSPGPIIKKNTPRLNTKSPIKQKKV